MPTLPRPVTAHHNLQTLPHRLPAAARPPVRPVSARSVDLRQCVWGASLLAGEAQGRQVEEGVFFMREAQVIKVN